MPILIKKIDGSIISYFSGVADADYSGDVILIRKTIGEVGLEDYFLLTKIEGFTQNFSAVINADFCETIPNTVGQTVCPTFINLNISY
jgi:hypothetical protein